MSTDLDGRLLLLVDDEEAFRQRTARALSRRGFEVREAASMDEAIAEAKREAPEIALVDLRLGADHGLDVVRELHVIEPMTLIIVLTGYGSIATAVDAVRLGAKGYLAKPTDISGILAEIERAATEVSVDRQADNLQPMTLARVEWEHIQQVLAECGHNISETARRLGMHRRSLQRKLQKYAPD